MHCSLYAYFISSLNHYLVVIRRKHRIVIINVIQRDGHIHGGRFHISDIRIPVTGSNSQSVVINRFSVQTCFNADHSTACVDIERS